ncbi:MAG TPA: phospholipase D family protein, partial [Hydrogenobaculum sp.]|nr:phospholipase D family protein [Hydrogenobaculum sp.]
MIKKIFLLFLVATFCLSIYSCSSKPSGAKTININNAQVSVYFSPNGGASDAIIKEIENAHSFIDIAMYAFTSRPIGQAVIDAYKRGVKVRLVMDVHEANTRFSRSRFFYKAGIPIKTLPVEETRFVKGLMHNKFAVIDGKEVITGSYNWTASAEKLNYENLLIIKSQKLADIYEKYFNWM